MPGLDALFLRVRRGGAGHEFGRVGEIGLAVEIEIERGADQRHAAQAGQRGAGEPAQRRPATLGAVEPVVAEADRRLDAELDADDSAVAAGGETRKSSGSCRQNVSFRSIPSL